MEEVNISMGWLVTWLLQFVFVGMITVIMFWIKRYIASADKKFEILFAKIDTITNSFNMQDKLISLFEDRIKRLETEIDKSEIELNHVKERIDKCKYCNSKE